MSVRRKYIRTLTQTLINKYGLSVPIDLNLLADKLGVKIKETNPDNPNLSGFYYRNLEKEIRIIGVNGSQSACRKRFTIAHELGHLLLHKAENVYVDRNNHIFQMNLRDQNSSKGEIQDEIEANLFAAELLMPIQNLQRAIEEAENIDLLDDDSLSDIANRFQVSKQALIFRLAYLEYIKV